MSSAQQSAVAAVKWPLASPLRVLVVDDDVDAADSLDLLLKALGHRALALYDGASALARYAEFRPDVVLIDLEMPHMTGIELARRIRSLDREASLVAVTGCSLWDSRVCRHIGVFRHYLLKPYGVEGLVGVLGHIALRSR